ncbi:hypothetical protein DTO021D3_6102 [Paecilomyces variotii]|nr:hypothetical protein DTO032I3_4257 [Paecilomyces variotii]KAJ9277004.1 hypothetical protein DTO021D3_6102 [Paecilomyces variotii]KAJ9347103.1 hypothetical protein DTO027B6_670 [Paecilomyces variotii]KAJ9393311.1 hypothetical protein DTO032I4_82 [Paecilomyces variotii]
MRDILGPQGDKSCGKRHLRPRMRLAHYLKRVKHLALRTTPAHLHMKARDKSSSGALVYTDVTWTTDCQQPHLVEPKSPTQALLLAPA